MSNPEGPVLRQDLFAGLVRYNMDLDLSDLQAEPLQLSLLPLKYSPRTPRPESEEDESVAAPVEKDQVMHLLDALDQSEEAIREQLAQLAGGEEVHRWQEAIATTMCQVKTPIPLREVQSRSNLSLVEVWLGLLLGGYQLRQQGDDFYDASQVWVEVSTVGILATNIFWFHAQQSSQEIWSGGMARWCWNWRCPSRGWGAVFGVVRHGLKG